MPALRPGQLLQALKLEGDVTVFIPKGRSCYYVYFRHAKVQISRSTGKKTYEEAKLAAAQIFASVVNPPQTATLNEVLDIVRKIAANPTTGPRQPESSVDVEVMDLQEALAAFLAEKKKKSWHTWNTLRIRCTKFVQHCTNLGILHVHDVTAKACYTWTSQQKVEARTRNKYLDDVSNFLQWCTMCPHRWAATNVAAKIAREPVPHDGTPEIFPASTAEALMRTLEAEYPQFACFYALTVFAGLRQDKIESEATRLCAAVKEDGWGPYIRPDHLRIPAGKTAPLRKFPLSDNLRQWLAAYPKFQIPTHHFHRKILRPLKIGANTMRHTAISAFVTAGGSMAKAASCFGNSEEMIKLHYLDFMTKEDVTLFYSILPKKIAAMPPQPAAPAPTSERLSA